jgi:hypothetical protein
MLMMSDKKASREQAIYQIKIRGKLDESWSQWFEGFQLYCCDEDTIITGPVKDQVALRSMLETLWDLNLTVISLARM